MPRTSCPVCGSGFSLSDRIAQPPVCTPCEKAGIRAPRTIVRAAEARTDLVVGRIVIVAAVAFAGYVAMTPSLGGRTSLGGKLALLVAAALAVFVGVAQSAAAKRRLRHSRD
jgi:hypothetical protein